MKRATVALGWGMLFGLGLALAGVPRPEVILGFLDVAGTHGAWDPTLGIALSAAVLVYAPLFRALRRRGTPLLAPRFDLPTQRRIDARLVLGAALFGAGWGAAGMCPGANLVALGSGDPSALLFALSWTCSLLLVQRIQARRASSIRALPTAA